MTVRHKICPFPTCHLRHEKVGETCNRSKVTQTVKLYRNRKKRVEETEKGVWGGGG